jgi:hypothetical protein
MKRNPTVRRAAHAFLQTMAGMLTAYVIAAACGMTDTVTGWRAALLVLLASAVSGVIGAAQREEGEEGQSGSEYR